MEKKKAESKWQQLKCHFLFEEKNGLVPESKSIKHMLYTLYTAWTWSSFTGKQEFSCATVIAEICMIQFLLEW